MKVVNAKIAFYRYCLKRSEYFTAESKADDCRFFVNNKSKPKQFLFGMLAAQDIKRPRLFQNRILFKDKIKTPKSNTK